MQILEKIANLGYCKKKVLTFGNQCESQSRSEFLFLLKKLLNIWFNERLYDVIEMSTIISTFFQIFQSLD